MVLTGLPTSSIQAPAFPVPNGTSGNWVLVVGFKPTTRYGGASAVDFHHLP
jgi:hypothetical protein